MEFILFLSKLDKEILDLLIKANYIVEENILKMQKGKQIIEAKSGNQTRITSKQKGQ